MRLALRLGVAWGAFASTGGNMSDAQAYNPSNLLDVIRRLCHLRSDLAFSRAFDISTCYVSGIRRHRFAAGPGPLLRIHEDTGLPIRVLGDLMGDRRSRIRHGLRGVTRSRVDGRVTPTMLS